MEPRDALLKKLNRVTLYAALSLILMFIVMFALTIFLAIQSSITQQDIKDAIASLEADASTNHNETRQYVRCIGDVLLEPINQRKPSDFDKCGVTGTSANPKPVSSPTPTAPITVPKQSSTSNTQVPKSTSQTSSTVAATPAPPSASPTPPPKPLCTVNLLSLLCL